MQGDKRYFGGLTNLAFTYANRRTVKCLDRFEYIMMEVGTQFGFANGSGAAKVSAEGHFDRVRKLLSLRPRKSRII